MNGFVKEARGTNESFLHCSFWEAVHGKDDRCLEERSQRPLQTPRQAAFMAADGREVPPTSLEVERCPAFTTPHLTLRGA